MNKTLLAIFSFISLGGFSQTVNNFYTTSVPQAGYRLGAGTVNETPSGANVSWDFSSLTANGSSITSVVAPSSSDVASYPGTQLVASSNGEYNGAGNTSNISIYTTGAGTITGLNVDGIILNYNTNNATLGTFPLQYGYSYADVVAGTYDGLGYTGTFSGSCTTSVDAYGTVSSSIGAVGAATLTRLKIVQNLKLYYLGLQIGTVAQTIYLYYTAEDNTPRIRSLMNNITVPALGVNYDFSLIELYDPAVLSTVSIPNADTVGIVPNPATETLHFTTNMGAAKVTITDAAGRIVLTGTGNDLNISGLTTGVYFAASEMDGKIQVTKFVKK